MVLPKANLATNWNKRYNKSGTIESHWVYEYDDQGEVTKETLLYPDGTHHEYYKNQYDKSVKVYQQLDNYQNCTKRIITDRNGKATIRTRKFEYYP